MSDQPPQEPGAPGGDRFRPRDRPESTVPLYHPDEAKPPLPVTPEERTADLRADVEEIVSHCRMIVARGEAEFFAAGDPRNRLAAKALLVDLATACEQLDEVKDHNHDLWGAVKRTRDKMAHHYRDTNFVRVWETISLQVPLVLQQLQGSNRDD